MAGVHHRIASFSAGGEYFAHSDPDGVLKIWKTATGDSNEQLIASNLSTVTCTCVQWGPGRHLKSPQPPRKKKRRKSSLDAAVHDADLAAGTVNGTILLFSTVRGQLHSQLDKGHTEEVTDLCWQQDSSTLYSSSLDGHVVEWRVSSSQLREKWKASKDGISSMCLCSSNCLLTADRAVKMWDLKTKSLLKEFKGHSTDIFRLLPVFRPMRDDSDTNICSHVLSAASGDRIINAWCCHLDSKDQDVVTSLKIPEEPSDIRYSISPEQKLTISVLTVSGKVAVFQCTLNGRQKRPRKPVTVVQTATAERKREVAVPILAVLPKDEDAPSLLLAYGSDLQPRFETVTLKTVQPEIKVWVERQDAETTKGVHSKTLGEKLEAMEVDKPGQSPAKAAKQPRADQMITSLTQGLQTEDAELLTSVFQEQNDKVITSTLRRLPQHVIQPLVLEISQRMHQHPRCGLVVVKWMKQILRLHMSYLTKVPAMKGTLEEMCRFIESRVQMLPQRVASKGRLQLLLSRIASQSSEEEDAATSSEPLLVYQDDSSDDGVPMDFDAEFGASESEDNWTDLD